MADLKALFQEIGYKDVVTYLQSGNVAFKTDSKTSSTKIQETIRKKLELNVPVLTLRASEILEASRNNPFLKDESVNPSHCYLTFLWEAPAQNLKESLTIPDKETGRFSIAEKCVYVYCPDGYGRTKINNQFFEKKLQVCATTRNWKTVSALCGLAEQ